MTDATATNFNSTENCINLNVTETNNVTENTEQANNCSDSPDNIDTINNLTISLETKTKSSTNTISKYILGKNGKDDTESKTKGHIKNSLNRLKRSNDRRAPIIVNYETIHSPEINNDNPNPVLQPYKISAPVKEELEDINIETLQEGGLANFNIETLHEPNTNVDTQQYKNNFKIIPQLQINEYTKHPNIDLDYRRNKTPVGDRNNNTPKGNDYAKGENDALIERKESSEEIESNKKPYKDDSYEKHSKEDDKNKNRQDSSIESEEKRESSDYKDNSEREEDSSNEDNSGSNEYRRNTNSDHSNKTQSNENGSSSNEDSSSSNEDGSSSNEDGSSSNEDVSNSTEDSDREKSKYRNVEDDRRSEEHDTYKESIEGFDNKPPNVPAETKSNRNSHVEAHPGGFISTTKRPIQDVDLRDFTYKESTEGFDNKPLNAPSEINSNRNSHVDAHPDDFISTTKRPIQDVDLRDFTYERIRVKDDGKVEAIDDTHNSNESADSKEIMSSDIKSPDVETKSKYDSVLNNLPLLETSNEGTGNQAKVNYEEIKPVVELRDDDASEEVIDDKELSPLSGLLKIDVGNEQLNKNDGILKQQFERIPLDYKHDKENNDEQQNNENNEQQDKTDTSEDIPSKEVEYDENLNIKFGDVTIRLPEIKLPEDVISYNYEEPSDEEKESDKEKNSEVKENKDEEEVDNDDDDFYSSKYYGEPEQYNNYREEEKEGSKEDSSKEKDSSKEEEEDENEDLYEKFVRERFGKRGSFKSRYEPEKKFERIRQAPLNPDLRDTLQKILKKTKLTATEAEKSNDPNAGYMWTLEYGQQL